MRVWKVFTLAAVALILAEVILAQFLTWLPAAIPTGLLAVLPPVAMAVGLVAYFEWRGRLKRRIIAGDRRPTHRGKDLATS